MAALSQTTAIWSVNNLSKYIKRFARDLTCWSIGPQIQTAKFVLFYTMYTRPQQVHIPVINWLVVSNWSSTSSDLHHLQNFHATTVLVFWTWRTLYHPDRISTRHRFFPWFDSFNNRRFNRLYSSLCSLTRSFFFPFFFFFRSWLAVFMLLP